MARKPKTEQDFAVARSRLMEEAQRTGLSEDYKFITTLARYDQQVKIIASLSKIIEEEGELVTKEYVKGRENVYIHPAIKELNNTSTSANNTMTTLLKILSTAKVVEAQDDLDKFLA